MNQSNRLPPPLVCLPSLLPPPPVCLPSLLPPLLCMHTPSLHSSVYIACYHLCCYVLPAAYSRRIASYRQALMVVSSDGAVVEYDLEPMKPEDSEKVTDESEVQLSTCARSRWNLGRLHSDQTTSACSVTTPMSTFRYIDVSLYGGSTCVSLSAVRRLREDSCTEDLLKGKYLIRRRGHRV